MERAPCRWNNRSRQIWAFPRTAIASSEMQRPARASRNHMGDLVRASLGRHDPWPPVAIEDRRKAAYAFRRMDAPMRIVRDVDSIVRIMMCAVDTVIHFPVSRLSVSPLTMAA